MSKIVQDYFAELLSRYSDTERQAFAQRSAVAEEDLEHLLTNFQQLPAEFIELLQAVGASNNSEVPMFYFNDDEFKLLPISTMIEAAHKKGFVVQPANLEFSDEELLVMRQDDELDRYMDDAINPLALNKDWLLIAENSEQGSKLFIDFNPGYEGKVGQIVGYFKDQNFYYVLADSLAELLELQVETNIPYYRLV